MFDNVVGTVFNKESYHACIYNHNGEVVGHLSNGSHWRLLDTLIINREFCFKISTDKYVLKKDITFKDGIAMR